MASHRQFVIALLAIVFLLWNPAGICAGTPGAGQASHPCCPKPPASPGHTPQGCVCIDRQPAAPTVPPLDAGQLHIAPPPTIALSAVALTAVDLQPSSAPPFAPSERYVRIHQLLL